MTIEAASSALLEAHRAPIHIGTVALLVHDLAAMTAFYRDAIGLEPIAGSNVGADLGVDGVVLVRLTAGAKAPSSTAGLFHLALLLPSRTALADWLAHAASIRLPLEGASDHLVSEALYLSDPEGNGIEIYRDRPRSDWPRDGGAIRMATERLDLRGLLAEASGHAWTGMPSGTRMGHIHLRVGDTAQAEAFYRDVLGFDPMVRYPGASFLATGGYHHHIAGNVWGSRDATPRRDGEAGLAWFALVAREEADFAAMRDRMLAAGGRVPGDPGQRQGPAIADPWGNRMVLVRA